MKLFISDYNIEDSRMSPSIAGLNRQIEEVLRNLPLHLKASDQKGKQGSPIFDPVGTNSSIKNALVDIGWRPNVPLPEEYNTFGTDVDFALSGVVAEVQFSNYPFLLNNLLRSQLLYKRKALLDGSPLSILVVITKAGMYPSSNSTLYYEQGQRQLAALSEAKLFDVPVRLIGLGSETGKSIPAKWTDYSAARTSRTVARQIDISVRVEIPVGQSRKAVIYRL